MLLIALALACGIAVVALGLPVLLFAPFTLIASLGIGSMIAIAHGTASVPFAAVSLPPPLDLAGAALSAVGLAAVVLRRRRSAGTAASPVAALSAGGRQPRPARLTPHRLAFGASLGGLCVLLAVVGGARPDGRLHIDVLDVGQGDAILVEGPDGGRMLVDTGPDPDRLITLLDTYLPAWDRRIDVVVITHPHEDHIAGLALLLERYSVGEVDESGMIGPGPGYAASRLALAALGTPTRELRAGDTLWLDGARLDVDWPLPGGVPLHPANGGKAINNVSIVLDVHYGARRALLTGDMEEEIDPQLLARGIADPDGRRLDVLKVAHHGSATATTGAFLAALRPRIAVISVGWGNVYGHPAPATVARLFDIGAQVFRTDLDGTVEISTDGADLIARPQGGRPHPTRPPSPGPTADLPPSPHAAGWTRRRTYNRAGVHSHSDPGRLDPARVRAVRLPAGALVRRRGSGLVHRPRAGPARRGSGHGAGRSRGAAP
jgi:competence protein ComEC